ncbi:MAG: signal recognition particle-docking protein FtsY [Rhodospirillaceae bacterium]|nr:signal recognition particle-docking protein FtsY [Rhodospirillaceae bacterium]
MSETDDEAGDGKKTGWLQRLKQGLRKTSGKLTTPITETFTKRRIDDAAILELEEALISADLGVATAARVARLIGKARFDKEVAPDEIKAALADEIAKILEPVAMPFVPDPGLKPHVVLVCGVNGSGKTTSVGKLAKQLIEDGSTVMLAAADTFRAAAVEQLQIWGERTGAVVVASTPGADAAGLAFDALTRARAEGTDVLLIDTAGRLQNKVDLMAELQKIIRVIRKIDDTAPHDCILVLDATVGQNAHSQVETFRHMVDVSGLIMTKLDGTARGGVVVALAEKFGLPMHAVGVGEGADDLRPFEARPFARGLVGLD